MQNKSNIVNQDGKRVMYLQVIEMPLKLRKEFIDKYSPKMQEALKRCALA